MQYTSCPNRTRQPCASSGWRLCSLGTLLDVAHPSGLSLGSQGFCWSKPMTHCPLAFICRSYDILTTFSQVFLPLRW